VAHPNQILGGPWPTWPTLLRPPWRAQFYKHLMASPKAVLLQLLLSIYCNSELKTDSSLTLAQLPINLLRKCVYTDLKLI
jgi:hypothetical protein